MARRRTLRARLRRRRLPGGLGAPGAAGILGLEEPDYAGSHFATVGGDLGSLALRKRRMVMLSVEGAEISGFNRFLWGTRPEPEDVLAARVGGWLADPLAGIFRSVQSRHQLVQFLENRHAWYAPLLSIPDNPEQALGSVAALKALDADEAGAVEAAEQWKDAVRGSPLLTRKVDGIIATIRRNAAG